MGHRPKGLQHQGDDNQPSAPPTPLFEAFPLIGVPAHWERAKMIAALVQIHRKERLPVVPTHVAYDLLRTEMGVIWGGRYLIFVLLHNTNTDWVPPDVEKGGQTDHNGGQTDPTVDESAQRR